MTQLRNRYETRMRDQQEAFTSRKEELEKKIIALKEANQKLKSSSQEEELAKKKLAKRYEMDVESVIKNYDTQVKEMAYSLSDQQEAFKKEQKSLNELKEHFEKVDEEKACIGAEEGVADARRAKMQAEKNRKSGASALVQAFWRGILQREQYTAMKKNKKKKGGGKKKK